MKGKGSAIITCATCQERFRVAAGRKATARFCSMACTRSARRDRRIKPGSGPGKLYTPAEDAIIRERYFLDGPCAVAKRIQRSRQSVKHRAAVLGVARIGSAPRWTAEEEEWLRDNFGKHSWVALQKKLGRTRHSIEIKAKRIHATRIAGRDYWSASDLALVFGVDPNTPERWISRGWLRARKLHDLGGAGTWQIQPEDVRLFVQKYPTAFDVRKVDQLSFLDLVLGIRTERRGERELEA